MAVWVSGSSSPCALHLCSIRSHINKSKFQKSIVSDVAATSAEGTWTGTELQGHKGQDKRHPKYFCAVCHHRCSAFLPGQLRFPLFKLSFLCPDNGVDKSKLVALQFRNKKFRQQRLCEFFCPGKKKKKVFFVTIKKKGKTEGKKKTKRVRIISKEVGSFLKSLAEAQPRSQGYPAIQTPTGKVGKMAFLPARRVKCVGRTLGRPPDTAGLASGRWAFQRLNGLCLSLARRSWGRESEPSQTGPPRIISAFNPSLLTSSSIRL